MNLLFPLGLLALLALPIIILLHLRRERLRRITVPSLILWQNLPRPRQGEKRRRLPLTLLLILHLLAATLIGLALSQPQWLQGQFDREEHLALVIDTSTSMRAQAFLNETRFDQARSRARTIINNMGEQDTIALIAAGSQARLLAAGGWDNSANLLAVLDALEAGGTGTDMSSALTLAQVALQNQQETGASRNSRIIVYSDLDPPQQNTLPADQVDWERVSGESDNLAIVALSARPRGSSTASYDIYTRIANYSNQQSRLTVRLSGFDEDGRVLDTDSNPIITNADSETELTWNVGSEIDLVEVELDHSDALPDDNRASISLSQFRPIEALLVTEPAEASDPAGMLERALRTIPDITLNVVPPADYASTSAAQDSDLTIFNNTLPERWPAGGVLVINPPASTTLLTVETTIATDGMRVVAPPLLDASITPLTDLNVESVNFDPVPVVQQPGWATVALALEDGFGQRIPLIMQGRTGQSEIAIWAFNLNEVNLTTRLAFPLLVAQTVRDLTPPPVPQSIPSGEPLVLQTDLRTESLAVRTPDQQTRQITPVTGTIRIDGLIETGLYDIIERSGDTTIYDAQVAVNAGSPLESNLRPRPIHAELTLTPPAALNQTPSDQPQENNGQPLWPWLALAGLAIIVIEWLYIHR